ncbi:MAG: dienelactone hydrolase family protein [Ignavibacteria bacterium]|nr:dienelactone hydrolase family protein [Ignavibacteria bacterium]
MKTLLLSLILIFTFMNISYSQKHDCCEEETTATEKKPKAECCEEVKGTTGSDITAPNIMAMFGNDESFKNEHPQPLTFTLADGKGKMITYKTSDGIDANGYEVKADNPTNNWVFLFHEWYGLNDYIKREAEEVASTLGNVNVLAIDLYDGKVATNNDEAVKYVQSVTNDRALVILNGAKDYAGSDAVFATYGWCFGGSWSNQAAIELGDRCKACVIYYGMPEQNPDRLAKLKAPVLGIFAKQDGRITPEVAGKFESDLKSLNIPATIIIYDAGHGFANPSNPKHDVTATTDAKEKTYAFLKEKMK